MLLAVNTMRPEGFNQNEQLHQTKLVNILYSLNTIHLGSQNSI